MGTGKKRFFFFFKLERGSLRVCFLSFKPEYEIYSLVKGQLASAEFQTTKDN